MAKAAKEIKGNCLKAAEKKTKVKVGNFCKGRVQFPLRELRKSKRTKVGNFWEGKHSFHMETQS